MILPYVVVVIDVEPIRERFSTVAPFLDERGRRLVAAAEAFAAGYGGIAAVAMATGMAPSTIGRGLKELAQDEPSERVRRPGAGRKPAIVKDPTLVADLEALVEPTTGGDPESPLRWTCKSVRRLAEALQQQGHQLSRTRAGALPHRNPVPDHCGWGRQQRLAGPAVETRTAEAGQRTRPRHCGQPPAARHQQVEQNRAPPFLLHQSELACPTPRQLSGDCRTDLGHYHQNRPHRAL